MRRLLLLAFVSLLAFLPLKAQDFSLADILFQSASAENAELTILLFALGESNSNLLQQLNDPNANLTILAPSDAAFIEFMQNNGLSLQDLADNPLLLNALVRYHILNESLSSAEISASENLLSLLPENSIRVSIQRNNVRLNETGAITRDGFVANNGVLHLIDEVLLPPTVRNMLLNRQGSSETANQTILEILQSREDLSTLTLALEQNGLLDTFGDAEQSFTLFAPNNAAFAALDLNADAITADMLLYHAFDNPFFANDLFNESTMTTLQGADLEISSDAEGLLLNETSRFIEADIQASNGVIHVMNAVLEIPD